MITINNKIKETPVKLYDPNHNLIGIIENDYAFMDVRIQIKEQQLEGYYVIFQKQKINITKHGRCSSWPVGFFDTYNNLLTKIL